MNIDVKGQTFLIGGVTAGFGRATAEALMKDGAKVIGIARQIEGLTELETIYKEQFIALRGNITQSEVINQAVTMAQKENISGVLINAGGPPAMPFEETRLSDWDDAYRSILRWKVELTQKLLPLFKSRQYGRIVFIESSSVKQPIENLVLSTSLRLAVVGLMKTISQEVSGQNITFNIVAPGIHDTAAINRLIDKKSQITGKPVSDMRREMISSIPAGKMGDPAKLGTLTAWLLSPLSEFVTGQVYTLEGGIVKSTL